MNMWKEYKEIAEKNGISRVTFNERVRNGMKPQTAATQPLRGKKYSKEYYKWRDVAEKNGINKSTYHSRVKNQEMDYKTAATTPIQHNYGKKSKKMNRIYAVYQGGEMVFDGTAQECADYLNIKLESFMWNTTPAAQRRVNERKNPEKALAIIDLGCDDDEEW